MEERGEVPKGRRDLGQGRVDRVLRLREGLEGLDEGEGTVLDLFSKSRSTGSLVRTRERGEGVVGLYCNRRDRSTLQSSYTL